MKIAFFEYRDEEKKVLEETIVGHDLFFCKDPLNSLTIDQVKDADIVCVFVSSIVKQEQIDLLPNLKMIATRSTGIDHIDVEYAQSKNIVVSNVPGYGAHTVAEFAFALMLSLSRKVTTAYNHIYHQGNFSLNDLEGFDLYDKTLGIVGTGKIGKHVANIAKGFDMKVVAFDICPDLVCAVTIGLDYVSLEELLKQSDIVTIHAPYMESTHHLINKDTLALMKPNALLINTARGELIDTEALVQALTDKKIAGAALDVLEAERLLKEESQFFVTDHIKTNEFRLLIEDHILLNMPNVLITPHIGFFSQEAAAEITSITKDNINNFLQGSPNNIVK